MNIKNLPSEWTPAETEYIRGLVKKYSEKKIKPVPME